MLRVVSTFLKKTDRKRWTDPRSFHADWEPRPIVYLHAI